MLFNWVCTFEPYNSAVNLEFYDYYYSLIATTVSDYRHKTITDNKDSDDVSPELLLLIYYILYVI
jgi:hypothetical protein